MTKIPQKPLFARPKLQKKKIYIITLLASPPPQKILGGTYKFSFVIKLLYFVVYLLKFKIW